MSNQLINLFLLLNIFVIGLRAEFYEDYEPTDIDGPEDFLQLLLKNSIDRNRRHRELGDDKEWQGRWFPSKLTDPTPFPKIAPKFQPQDHAETNPSDADKQLQDLQLLQNALNRNKEDKAPGNSEEWTGRWFPSRPSDPTPSPKIFPKSKPQPNFGFNSLGMIPMGVKSPLCDDGKTNLTVDWNDSPVNYTCYGNKIEPDYRIDPEFYCEKIPKNYVAMHKCMQDIIEYDDDLPLYGTHRPIWPVYGEYKFLPRQRWLHSLEHGAVVMLYHPCANPLEVQILKKLVTDCIRRHVISSSNFLTLDRPLALLTWGCRLKMSYVDPNEVQDFILKYTLKGPEEIETDGDFEKGLLKKAEIVSDIKDSVLCPTQYEV